jgi:excisionase family DNA binding protein
MVLSEPMLTTHDVAELLKVSEATVRTWIHSGDLRAIRVGREYRLVVKDLDQFLETRATRPAEQREHDESR